MGTSDRLKIAVLVALVAVIGVWSFSLMRGAFMTRLSQPTAAPKVASPPGSAATVADPSATAAVVAIAVPEIPEVPASPPDAPPAAPPAAPPPTPLEAAVARFQEERDRLDRTVWADERLAQEHEAVFVALWDAVRAAEDKTAALASLTFDELTIGSSTTSVAMEDGISVATSETGGRAMDHAVWAAWLATLGGKRQRLVECEFHQTRFEPAAEGARSTIAALLHIIDDRSGDRYIVRGPLEISWSPTRDAHGRPSVHAIDATRMSLLSRQSPPVFTEVPQMPQLIRRGIARILVYDLDHDGFSDIVLPSSNRLLHNQGDGTYEARQLLAQPGQHPSTGLIADVTNDGNADLILSEAQGPRELQAACLVLYPGNARGAFTDAGVVIAGPDVSLDGPCLTAGDIDGDGDLDLFVARYQGPYVGGRMPTPYYDANDGFASHLLLNTGGASFADVTRASGLSAKSHRRTCSASFIDLDDDGDLDLVEVSDFSGVDVFWNDGIGGFTDVTTGVLDERSLFGRSHCFADFNHDGQLDILVTGITSSTVGRLAGLGLGRVDFPKLDGMRARIAYGNRLYCRTPDGSFKEPAFKDQVADSGWSCGVAAIDFDNDGDCDLAIANGNLSGATAQDYDPTFWCHDIYADTARPDRTLELAFRRRSEQKISWHGFGHNALYLNTGGRDFTEVGFLMGTSIEQDCRALIVDDLDMDGHPDLIVEEESWKDLGRAPGPNEMMGRYRLLKNGWKSADHWLGIRLREEGRGLSPIGATIIVRTPSQTLVQKVVTGDAFYAQHANAFHFGLGLNPHV
ncbi:MAG: CRTAC1 family protein, partial [Planctomycetes bacterium]|nr:CRTAC1 family protein [Planctomycetota bacterium]